VAEVVDVAAVDIGGSRLKAAIVRSDGTYELARTLPTPPDLEFRLGEVVGDVVAGLTRDLGRPPAAVGLAAPGLVDDTRALGVFSANLGWRALDLRRPVAMATGLPVAVGHDVRAGLLAECWLGAATDCSDVAFVPIGTGVAAALLVDGRELVAGGFAGEIGHVVVVPDGPACGCGGRGCLEAVAAAPAIARAYAQRAGLDPTAAAGCDAQAVAALVAAGDQVADAVWTEAVDHLARVLATVALAAGTQQIVVGGGLAQAGEVLLSPLQARITTYGGALRPLRVVAAALGDFAGCLGAGRLALRLLAAP